MLSKSRCGFLAWCLPAFFTLFCAGSALATTYYVSPSGSNSLSTNSGSPGSLSYACANAGSGSTVILENGTYNGSPNGFSVANSTVTFQAQNWHGATVENTTGSTLWGPGSSNPTGDICQGIVFGPSTGLGWSGGGGGSWQFLDCVFTQNGGVGAGNSSVFENDLFTDASSNAFDFANSNQSVINCVVRRSNRSSADDDAVGNKESGTSNFLVNGLVSYDNNCPAMWFDTANDGWTVENSTFFGNHGGNNWYYCGVGSGTSTTVFTGYGQDGQSIAVGQPIRGLSGVNNGYTSVVTAVSGYNPQTITVSPALHGTPAANDQFAVQQGGASSGDGFITEANDDGTFTNNWVYGNTDAGYFDHSSGGTTYGGSGGLTITDNLFAYDGEGYFVWSDSRDQGPAKLQYNQFLFTPGSSNAFDSWGGTPGTYPVDASIDFDYNDYDATNSQGNWAYWFSNPVVAGGLTAGSQPSGQETVNGTQVYQDYLQNTSTWDQDLHGNTNAITFYGTSPSVYIWPAATDTNWSDVYFPNNTFGTSNSIHQINDSNGASTNTIDGVIDGKSSGSVLTIPVSAHSPLTGSGPYTCSVYDLNGRWVTLTVPTANESTFLAAVPPYVTCTSGNATQTYNIQVTLNSTPPYNVTATYNPSGGGGYTGSLSGSYTSASSSTYNFTSLGTSDWAHWDTQFNHKSSGGSQISNVTQIGGGNYGTWNLTNRNVSWSDGTPTTSNSDDQNYIWCNDVANAGWTFTAPASTTSRTLNVLLGGAAGTTIKVVAHLSDDTGDTKDYSTTIALSGTGPTYLFSFTYAAESSGQTLEITLTNTTNSASSVDLVGAWLTGGTVTGSLSGSEATASTSTYNLTSLGTTDWSHWNNNGWIHDSSGGSQISNVTQTSGGSFGNWDVTSRNVSWTNGTPTTSNSDDDYYIWCNGTTGQGWTFTAPATTTSHTLYILCGGDGGSPYAAIKINAHLSDGSASDYTDTRTTTSSANLFLYTITYNAASAGKTLTITLTKNDSDSGTSVDLDAAWLH